MCLGDPQREVSSRFEEGRMGSAEALNPLWGRDGSIGGEWDPRTVTYLQSDWNPLARLLINP